MCLLLLECQADLTVHWSPLGSYGHGRVQRPAASPTPPCVPNAEELATLPLTASSLGKSSRLAGSSDLCTVTVHHWCKQIGTVVGML